MSAVSESEYGASMCEFVRTMPAHMTCGEHRIGSAVSESEYAGFVSEFIQAICALPKFVEHRATRAVPQTFSYVPELVLLVLLVRLNIHLFYLFL